eukprot:403371940
MCPGCDQSRTLPQELNENLQIMKELRTLDQLTVICDKHLSKTATLYCLNCDIAVCSDCRFTTHQDHQHTDLKQSKFKIYTTNVKSMFDEYSVLNMKYQLDNQANNEIQQTASQFQSMVSKVSRMLGHLTKDEETNKIDLSTCLGEPQNDSWNIKENSKIFRQIAIQGNDQYKISLQDIKHMINESQALLREEFKQALNAFETNLNNKESITNSQTNQKMKHIEQNNFEQLQQFKQAMNADLQARFKYTVKEKDLNLKLQNMERAFMKLNEQAQNINGKYAVDSKFQKQQLDQSTYKVDQTKQLSNYKITDSYQQRNNFHDQASGMNSQNQSQIDIKNEIDNQEILQDVKQRSEFDSVINNIHEKSSHYKKSVFQKLVYQEINKTDQSLLKPLLIKDGVDKKFQLLFKGSTNGIIP